MSSAEVHDATAARLGISSSQLQGMLDGLTDAAVVVNLELRPVAWNALYVQQSGLRALKFRRAADSPGARCRDFLRLDICDSSCLAKRVAELGRPMRVDEIHGGHSSESAKDLTLIVTATPLFDARGAPVAILEVYRDVTAEARIQARYKVLLDAERDRAEQLEEQVRLRTADLQRSLEELKQTRAQLIQAEKLSSLGQLVAGLAHEINNPVNFIYGNVDFLNAYVDALTKVADFLEAQPIDDEARRALGELKTTVDYDFARGDVKKIVASIKLGIERVTGIIRDLRRFIHGGNVAREPIHLERCIDVTVSLLRHELKGKHTLEREYASDLPQVLANEGQLSQVFMNLIVNALQALNNGGKVIVRVVERDHGVAVDVVDNGVGISEQNQLKVFDPFFTTKPVGQGTGMGLAIAYSIVDSHGGKLSVRSKEGAGSTFTVWLPLAPAAGIGPKPT